jgi:hypothetical protein
MLQGLVLLTAILPAPGDADAALALQNLVPALASGGLIGLRIFGACVTIAFYALLIMQISAGRNWARITFLISFVVSLPSYLGTSIQMLEDPSVGAFLISLQFWLSAFAAFCLCTAPGRNRFRARR